MLHCLLSILSCASFFGLLGERLNGKSEDSGYTGNTQKAVKINTQTDPFTP